VETWDNPLLGLLFNIWEAIPIRRGEADLEAFRLAEAALAQGKMLTVAPEGTRSGTGVMQKGKPGMILLACAAALPFYRWHFTAMKPLAQPAQPAARSFHVRVGNPFTLDAHGQRLTAMCATPSPTR
jgi:1-acyl-sn-glycerol-3-phosphate acyltransferase